MKKNPGMETYEMNVKHRCRKHFRRFIQKQFRKRDFSNLQVLCFPGLEALEIKEVFDPLGIKRENIWCLEYNKDVYKELKRSGRVKGCNLLNKSLYEYVRPDDVAIDEGEMKEGVFKFEARLFDIVSLDFTGQLGTYIDDVYSISEGGWLSENAIVFTNFCGSRDCKATKAYYYSSAFRNSDAYFAALNKYANDLDIEKDKLDILKFDPNRQDLGEIRDRAVTDILAQALKAKISDTSIFNDLSYLIWDKFVDTVEKRGTIGFDGLIGNKAMECFDEIKDNKFCDLPSEHKLGVIKRAVDYIAYNCMKRHGLVDKVEDCIIDKKYSFNVLGSEVSVQPYHFVQSFLAARYYYHLKEKRKIERIESYKYVSANGMPMLSDIFHIKESHDLSKFDFLDCIFDWKAKDFDAFIKPFLNLTLREMYFANEFSADLLAENWRRNYIPERIMLGKESDFKKVNHPKVEVLNDDQQKVKVLELIKNNPTISNDKLALLTGASIGRIAAVKAHLTRGSYD